MGDFLSRDGWMQGQGDYMLAGVFGHRQAAGTQFEMGIGRQLVEGLRVMNACFDAFLLQPLLKVITVGGLDNIQMVYRCGIGQNLRQHQLRNIF